MDDIAPHMVALQRHALGLTHNPTDAEDILQEALLHGYSKYGTFTDGTNVRAWMHTILRNVFINLYRKKQRRPVEVELTEILGGMTYPSAEKEIMNLVIDNEVRSALYSLPEVRRDVFLRVAVQGASYEDIADTPISTSRVRLHRAKKTMKAQLTDYATRKNLTRSAARTKNAAKG